MHIKIYGTPTSGKRMIKNLVGDILHKAKIPFEISEVHDVTDFIDKNIDSIPAIQVDEKPIIGLKSNGSFIKSLRDAVNHILSIENYGEISKFIIPVDFSNTSVNALSYGHRLATELKAVTKVVHVHDPNINKCYDQVESTITKVKSKERLFNLVKSLDHDWGSDILKASFLSPDFRVGLTAQQISNSVEDNQGELIILGSDINSHSVNGCTSTTQDIIDNANCPILIVSPKAKYKGLSKLLPGILKDDDIIEIGNFAVENNIDIIALSPPKGMEYSNLLLRMGQKYNHFKGNIPVLLLK